MIKSFDSDWRFHQGELSDAQKTEFDDRSWRQLDVPHDWSIEGPFDKDNPTRGSGGFLPAGIGWYRKQFILPTNDANRRVFIEFDGVMANSDVWINGFHLGRRPYGYVSFSYELTGHLNFEGKPNVLAVRADNSGQPASRWYSGAGIYRHVRLVVTNPVHVGQWGTFVTTPKISDQQASVNVTSRVINQADNAHVISIQTKVIAPTGEVVAGNETPYRTIAPGESLDIARTVTVKHHQRWDLDHPYIYRLVTIVNEMPRDKGPVPLDEEVTPFGIREFKFDADTGFWLNGRNFKLKGVCIHHDGGAFGAAVPLRVWEDVSRF